MASVDAAANALAGHPGDHPGQPLGMMLAIVGAGCGLRPGELLALEWRAIDLQARTLRVVASLGDDGRSQTTLKTRRSRRAERPAIAAAGVEHPHSIYDLRHTYATWALPAGVSIFQLVRRIGTSADMIELTYGHLAADAAEHELGLLDAWDGA